MANVLNKFYVRVLVSAVFGFLLAGTYTHIQYPCPPLDSAGCVSFEKAIMHPDDLAENKQGSLADFMSKLAVSSLVSFALLTAYNQAQKKKT